MRTLILVGLLSLASDPARAGGPTGGADTFNFLFLDAGARPVAMGGAYTSLASGADALLYNPAGLGMLHAHEATFMHSQYLDEGLKQEYFAGALRPGFGANFNYFGFGRVPRTTYSLPTGTGIGDYGLTDLALGIGYGRTLFQGFSAGFGYKFVREEIDKIAASGHAADLGVLYASERWRGLRLGAALQNLGPSVRFQEPEELPLTFRWGASYGFHYRGLENTLSVDGMKTRGDRVRAAAGVETVLAGTLALRLGFSGRVDAGPGVTAGVGVRMGPFLADYAFVPYGSLGNAHRASVTWRWGIVEEPEPPAPRKSPEESAGEASKSRPPSADERFERAEALIADGSYDEARIELYEAAKVLREGDRRRVRFHERLGQVAYLKREFSQAKDSYGEAVRLAGIVGAKGAVVADAYAGIGLCLLEQKEYSYAKKFLIKALEAGPSEKTRAVIRQELNLLEE